jgi:hypothetical protein
VTSSAPWAAAGSSSPSSIQRRLLRPRIDVGSGLATTWREQGLLTGPPDVTRVFERLARRALEPRAMSPEAFGALVREDFAKMARG